MPSERVPRRFGAGTRPALKILVFFLAVLPAAPGPLPSQSPPEPSAYREYDVKAVFLYHFTRYLEWPVPDEGTPFEIAVLGESAIVEPLQTIAATRTVGRRPIRVRAIDRVDALGRPHILFVARPAAGSLRELLKATRGTAILTVGEEEGLAAQGLAVNFVLRDGAVKFEVNEEVLREGGIRPGAQLMKLAIPAGTSAAGGGS